MSILNLVGYLNVQPKMKIVLEDSKHQYDQLLEWRHRVNGSRAKPYPTVCLLLLQVCPGLPQHVYTS